LQTRTIKDSLIATTPAIAEIVIYCGAEKGALVIRAMLVLAIENLNSFFNISKPMTDLQTIETINLICQRFSYFRMDDFKLCFDRMKMGFYGKTYNRIDGQILFEALNSYDVERMEEAEILNMNKHEQLKKGIDDGTPINIEGQKEVIEILKDAIKHTDIEAVKPTSKGLKCGESHIDVLSQKWFRQFDKLHDKFGTSSLGSKYIKRYGRVLSCSEYLDYKINQWRRVNK
jgi:hypothetical protein